MSMIPENKSKNWRTETRLVRGGTQRSKFDETSEGIYMTSGYVYDSAEKAAMANMVANQKKLIRRAKNREAIGGEMPGTSRTEEAIGSKTAQAAERLRLHPLPWHGPWVPKSACDYLEHMHLQVIMM